MAHFPESQKPAGEPPGGFEADSAIDEQDGLDMGL